MWDVAFYTLYSVLINLFSKGNVYTVIHTLDTCKI